MASAKAVKISLTKICNKAKGGGTPKAWQAEAIVKAAEWWDKKQIMLFDHPRGSGKTREMAMMTHVALRLLGTRLVILVTDRCDLEQNLSREAERFLQLAGHRAGIVVRCSNAKEVHVEIDRLESETSRVTVVAITLQTFPHIERQLSAGLRRATAVLADEVHRSHADKSLSEELERVLGRGVKLLMYTGTATDRCLRLFGDRAEVGGVQVCRPFHAVSEAEVARAGMIFELGHIRRKCLLAQCDMSKIDEVARRHELSQEMVRALHALGGRTSSAIGAKAALLLQELWEIRGQLVGYKPLLMVVCESRQAVLDYVEAFKALGSQRGCGNLSVYGAFSGHLLHRDMQVDEGKYNRLLRQEFGEEAHRKADILVVCDRFETGYDNSDISLMGVDRRMGSPEKLAQVYSRANRVRPGKSTALIIDFQNASKDVEHALLQFSVPREVLASADKQDAVALSRIIQETLAPVGEGSKVELAAFFETQEAEERRTFASALAPYLRCRKAGVDREAGDGLVPYSRALLAWEVLRERHPSETTYAKQQTRDIVNCNSIMRGFSVLCDQSQLPTGTGLGLEEFQSPKPKRNGSAGEDETPEKPVHNGRLAILEAMQADLPNDVQPSDHAFCIQSQPQTQLQADINLLRRCKSSLKRSGFDALQRVVALAGHSQRRQELVDFGAVDALVMRLQRGDASEKRLALHGISGLAVVASRAAKIRDICAQIDTLGNCAALRKDVELKALQELARLVTQEKQAVEEDEKLATEIGGVRKDLAGLADQLRRVRTEKKGILLHVDSSSDSEEEDGPKSTKKARVARLLQRRGQAQTKLAQLEGKRSSELDMGTFAALGMMAAVVRHVVSKCARRGSAPVRVRELLCDILQHLAGIDENAASIATVVADVKLVRAMKRRKSLTSSHMQNMEAVARRSRSLSDELRNVGIGLGIVDDLLTISTGRNSCLCCMELLEAFAHLDARAKDRVVLFNTFKEEEDEIAAAIERLRTSVAIQRKRAHVSVERSAIVVST